MMVTDILNPVPLAVSFAILVLFGAMFLALCRLIIGPTLIDRVIALDLITTLTVGIIACYSIHSGKPVFIRPALVLAMISFLATIAFGYYVGKRGRL